MYKQKYKLNIDMMNEKNYNIHLSICNLKVK